jgi:hypothetical protein
VEPPSLIVNPDNVGGVYATSIVLKIDSKVLPAAIVTPEIIPPTFWFGVIACCKIVVEAVVIDPVIPANTVNDPVITALPLTYMAFPSSYTMLCSKVFGVADAFTR